MRKKLLTLVLSFVMVFTMTVPSFAGTLNTSRQSCKKAVYVVLGDSVAAGYNDAGTEEALLGENSQYRYRSVKAKYGIGRNIVVGSQLSEDTRSINYIERAFPALFANILKDKDSIVVDEKNSYNMSMPGFRPKEYCYLFGLMSKKEIEDAENDTFMQTFLLNKDGSPSLPNTMKAAAKDAKRSLAKADIINIQLGMNDFNAAMRDYGKWVTPLISMLNEEFGADIFKLISIGAKEEPTVLVNEEALEELDATAANEGRIIRIKDMINQLSEVKTSQEKAKLLVQILCEASKSGCNIAGTVAAIDKHFKEHTDEYKKYMNRFLAYIRLINPKANVIIINTYNPLINMLGDSSSQMVDTIFKLLGGPSVKRVNSADKSFATLYNATVADISNTTPGDPAAWICHPDDDGHAAIADTVYNAYKCDVKRRTLNKAVATAVIKEVVNDYRNR